MQEPEVLEREDRAGAATMLQLMESQEYFASPEGACKPVVETGADEQADGVEAEEVHGGEGFPEDYSHA